MHDYLAALLGGGMIGLAAIMMMLGHGRVMGVSGIVASLLPPYSTPDSHDWRVAFIIGTVAAPLLFLAFTGASPDIKLDAPPLLLIISGLIVGFGTVTGNGCTSGHGVCGLARFSTRSMIATPIFMLTAMLTVFMTRHIIGG